MKIIFINNRQYKDLNPLGIGFEKCKSGKLVSNYPRDHTVIHYVYSGCGILKKGNKTYKISAGQCFIILEGEKATYEADEKDPWVYSWVCFNGERSSDFSRLPVVFEHSGEPFDKMIAVVDMNINKESYIASILFSLHSEIEINENQSVYYVKKIINIINVNYMYDLRVEKIAEEMNLNRHYISSLFKRETGKSIIEYIIFVRMSEAKKYLMEGRGVTETAGLVGYTDSSTFSKMFKKYCEVSPIKYRKYRGFYDSEGKRIKSIEID